MMLRLALASASVLLATATVPAQKLAAGSPAPPMTVEKWVKGEPVQEFAKGKVYVVEFWATWCGPCIASMPHLSRLQRKYEDQGVTIIGMTSEDPRNSLAAVEKMVADKGEGMDYAVAWDKGRATSDAFMAAAGQAGIPCSFVVDKSGTLAYIGHPRYLDVPLAEIVAGTWDIQKGNAAIAEARNRLSVIYAAIPKEPTVALARIAEFEAAHPGFGSLVASVKLDALLAAGDLDAAFAHGSKLVDEAIEHGDAMELNRIAWLIVDPNAKRARMDLPLALRAAEKGVALTKEMEGSILDTLARVHFLLGDLEKAIEIQTKAVGTATGGMKAALERNLADYEARRRK